MNSLQGPSRPLDTLKLSSKNLRLPLDTKWDARLLQRRHVPLGPGSWRDDACIILVGKALVIQDNLKVEKYRKY